MTVPFATITTAWMDELYGARTHAMNTQQRSF
jgi:hypothetical protein